MHELDHALSIGWADDKGPGHIAECYSGQRCVEGSIVGQIGVGGGMDETPEFLVPPGSGPSLKVWSIMALTNDPLPMNGPRFAFSLEELSTVDFTDIPSTDG